MTSRYLRHAVTAWAICISGTLAVAAEPGNPDREAIAADVKFAEKLNEFIRLYLNEAPGRAREMQGALKQLLSDRSKELLQYAKLPKTPSVLTPEQIDLLELIIASYPDTDGARIASAALADHRRLLAEPLAQEALKAVELQTPNDELTGDQIKLLDDLRAEFPDSDAAKTASAYLARQRKRDADKVLAELVEDFLKTPGAREALDRLAYKRLEFAMSLVESQRVIALEELVENFPNSSAAKVASGRLADALRQIDRRRQMIIQEGESSRYLREYWDARYPQRTWKYPVETPGPNSAEYRPSGLPEETLPTDGLPPVPAEMRKE